VGSLIKAVSDRYDVIIAGAGIAGLYTALNLDKTYNVLVLSKEEVNVCNSALAQGGVAAVLDTQNDCSEQHAADTLKAGGYENDLTALDVLVNEGAENVLNLSAMGAVFDMNEEGNFCLALEGGHSRRRIAHSKDSTGKEIVRALYEKVKLQSNITLLENAHLIELENVQGMFYCGVFADGGYKTFSAPVTVLATGGIGRVYSRTTNSKTATGDGIYFAHKLGAEIKNISYIQFHPTALCTDDNGGGQSPSSCDLPLSGHPDSLSDTLSQVSFNSSDLPLYGQDTEYESCFLLSEALRGEGAVLLNCNKQPFMQIYEPERKDLAPRDVVSGCIIKEERKTGSKNFCLDISFKESDFIRARFPMIYGKLLEKGFDLTKEPIPVYPCQHYLMGGIAVNTYGETNIPNLYAVGECSCTGVHGNNRLASNSLLEAIVFPRRAAKKIMQGGFPNSSPASALYRGRLSEENFPPAPFKYFNSRGIIKKVQNIMQKAFFVEVNKPCCKEGLREITAIRNELERGNYKPSPELTETKAISAIAELILGELLNE
jgi:L-aspartate oxidase